MERKYNGSPPKKKKKTSSCLCVKCEKQAAAVAFQPETVSPCMLSSCGSDCTQSSVLPFFVFSFLLSLRKVSSLRTPWKAHLSLLSSDADLGPRVLNLDLSQCHPQRVSTHLWEGESLGEEITFSSSKSSYVLRLFKSG